MARRIHVLLKWEGIQVNHKRVYRLYCLERLQLYHNRPRRHVSAAHHHQPLAKATRRNEAWAMDFVADRLHGGAGLHSDRRLYARVPDSGQHQKVINGDRGGLPLSCSLSRTILIVNRDS